MSHFITNQARFLFIKYKNLSWASGLGRTALHWCLCRAFHATLPVLGRDRWEAGAGRQGRWRDDGKMGEKLGENMGKTWGSSWKKLGQTWGNSWNKLGKVLKIMEEHDSCGKVGKMKKHSGKWWQSDNLNLGHWCWGSLESQIMVDNSFLGGEGMIVYWGSKIGNSLWEACQMWNTPTWIIREARWQFCCDFGIPHTFLGKIIQTISLSTR